MPRTPEDDARLRQAIRLGTMDAAATLASPGMAGLLAEEERQLLADQAEEADRLTENLTNRQRSKWTEEGARKDVATLRRFAAMRS